MTKKEDKEEFEKDLEKIKTFVEGGIEEIPLFLMMPDLFIGKEVSNILAYFARDVGLNPLDFKINATEIDCSELELIYEQELDFNEETESKKDEKLIEIKDNYFEKINLFKDTIEKFDLSESGNNKTLIKKCADMFVENFGFVETFSKFLLIADFFRSTSASAYNVSQRKMIDGTDFVKTHFRKIVRIVEEYIKGFDGTVNNIDVEFKKILNNLDDEFKL